MCIYHKLCVSEQSGRKFAKYFYKSSPHSIPSFWLTLMEKMECRTISHVCFWCGKALKKLYNHSNYYTGLPKGPSFSKSSTHPIQFGKLGMLQILSNDHCQLAGTRRCVFCAVAPGLWNIYFLFYFLQIRMAPTFGRLKNLPLSPVVNVMRALFLGHTLTLLTILVASLFILGCFNYF